MYGTSQGTSASNVACDGANEIYALAAALGGCRLLRERLALIRVNADEDNSLRVATEQEGERMLRQWSAARQKLLRRFVVPEVKIDGFAKFNALSKVVHIAQAEGFETKWEEAQQVVLHSIVPRLNSEATLQESTVSLHPASNVAKDINIENEVLERLNKRWDARGESREINNKLDAVCDSTPRARTAPSMAGRNGVRLSPMDCAPGSPSSAIGRDGHADVAVKLASMPLPADVEQRLWSAPASPTSIPCSPSLLPLKPIGLRSPRKFRGQRTGLPWVVEEYSPYSCTATPRMVAAIE